MPPLSAEQAAHSAALRARIGDELQRRGGWLSFEDYLQLVLYAPGLGYYSAGAQKFGATGDFTTAPELSALFGQCVARQCAPLLQSLGTDADLLELGAGSGRLAATVLTRLAELQALPRRYLILEVSAELRERQRALLAQLPDGLGARVEWLDALPAEPLRGVVLANEVADALPFRRFERNEQGLCELGVSADAQGALQWSPRPAGDWLQQEYRRINAELPTALEPYYASELCPLLNGWIASLASVLQVGMVLLFDYGFGRAEYYHPDRRQGTLRCHYRHRAHDDPFLHPGLQDITAWVDFTRVAEAASDASLEISGYCTQAAFLLGAGIEAELAGATDPVQRARLAGEARRLLMPGEMGESFKAMALTRQWSQPLAGFAVQDLRRLL